MEGEGWEREGVGVEGPWGSSVLSRSVQGSLFVRM